MLPTRFDAGFDLELNWFRTQVDARFNLNLTPVSTSIRRWRPWYIHPKKYPQRNHSDSWGRKSPTRRSTVFANVENNAASDLPAFANAHAMLAKFWHLLPIDFCCAAAPASAANSNESKRPAVAYSAAYD